MHQESDPKVNLQMPKKPKGTTGGGGVGTTRRTTENKVSQIG